MNDLLPRGTQIEGSTPCVLILLREHGHLRCGAIKMDDFWFKVYQIGSSTPCLLILLREHGHSKCGTIKMDDFCSKVFKSEVPRVQNE